VPLNKEADRSLSFSPRVVSDGEDLKRMAKKMQIVPFNILTLRDESVKGSDSICCCF